MTVPDDIQLPKPRLKPKTDWEAVGRDYRTGQFTEHELAAKYRVSRSAVNKQITKNGWTKDLRDEIRQATESLLVHGFATEKVAEVAESGKEVASVIDVAAEVNVRVIMGHRTGLSRITRVKELLLNQVEQQAANLPELSEIIEIVRSPDENGRDRANDMLRAAMERSTLVDDLKKLTEIDERVRKGEREAFSLNSTPPDDDKSAHAVRVKFV